MVKSFYEMSDSKTKFEDRLKDEHLKNAIAHLLKLRLTTEWGDLVYPGLKTFLSRYSKDWIKQSQQFVINMTNYIRKVSVSGGNKRKLYPTAIEDFVTRGFPHLVDAISEGFDEFKDKKKAKVGLFYALSSDGFEELGWVKDMIKFFRSLTPEMTKEQVVSNFNTWVGNWLLIV